MKILEISINKQYSFCFHSISLQVYDQPEFTRIYQPKSFRWLLGTFSLLILYSKVLNHEKSFDIKCM